MTPTSVFKEIAENASPESDFASKRLKNIQELAAARMALAANAKDFNTQMAQESSNKRRHTFSPGKYRDRSPLMERKSSRLSGKVVDYAGLEYDDYKGSKKWLDDDERLFANLKPGVKRRRRSTISHRSSTAPILEVEDVSTEMISMISYASTHKVYSSEHGKSCHQCRQKTLDTKSVCRSGTCIGVRGQFCGACLKDHYGEDLAEVLMDPNWSCPMCKNICNCSFCRKKAGKAPLGQISEMARRKGFKSVHHFLMEHEGFDYIEEEEQEPPKRKLRQNDSKENEHYSSSEEVERKPRISGLTIKLPFKTSKKASNAPSQQKVLGLEKEREIKKQRKTIKTKEEMEKLVVKMEGALPVTTEEMQIMKRKLEQDLSMDWKAILESDEESFEGFPESGVVEYLTKACSIEDRLDKFKVKNYLQNELEKVKELSAIIKQEVFTGFSDE